MKRKRRWIVLVGLLVALAPLAAACGGGDDEEAGGDTQGPIVIGAAVDQTNFMRFFDGPALAAAQIWAKRINAQGGVNGRRIEFMVENTQLKPDRTKAAALELLNKGADVLWVTCDVDWSTPSAQQALKRKVLAVAPCIGTDQMGPKRFGEQGKLAFSFGNVAQDEGAALAELAIKKGWKTATVVTDKAIVYTQNVCQAFTKRFTERGGRIVRQESFTQGDGTIGSVVSRVNNADADAIAICTITQKDLPTFVSGIRSLGNRTPIIGPWSEDGAFWLPKNPRIADNSWIVTFASVYGDDPNPQVRDLIAELKAAGNPPATGGFVTGPAALQAIVAAIKKSDGSTEGSKLAEVLEDTKNLPTVSGNISFSEEFHTVFGRQYRIIEVRRGKPRFAGLIKASSPADID